MTQLSEPRAKRVARLWPVVSGGTAIVLALLLGVVVTLRATLPIEIDNGWMADLVQERTPLLDTLALVVSWIGGGWFGIFLVPIAIAGVFLLLRRPWAALYAVLSFAVSAGVVQLLKQVFGRARPEEILISADFGSFPSGHTANAATIAVVLFILVGRWWVLAAGLAWTILMALSRTYLGAHWVTDTVGGMLLGAAVGILVWAPFALTLHHERHPEDASRQ